MRKLGLNGNRQKAVQGKVKRFIEEGEYLPTLPSGRRSSDYLRSDVGLRVGGEHALLRPNEWRFSIHGFGPDGARP